MLNLPLIAFVAADIYFRIVWLDSACYVIAD
jgi:hypothetical protein